MVLCAKQIIKLRYFLRIEGNKYNNESSDVLTMSTSVRRMRSS